MAFFSALIFPATGNAITFEQMEEGAAALATMQPTTQLTPSQMESVLALKNYSEGFFAVPFNSQLLATDKKQAEPIYKPAAWMSDPKKSAASLLNFIVRHKPSKPNAEKPVNPTAVFMAWYLCNCENSGWEAKFNAAALLGKVFGGDFPGADELKKEINEESLKELKR